jgi:amino acid transporter, AAT family
MDGSTNHNHQHELHRSLKNRHIQMIALGGAIGTGLFYGSATTIKLAGPAITISYFIGGLIIFLIMRALGEMSVHQPVSGSFSQYAYQYWGEFPGFLAGWNYWFNYIAVSMAELSVVGVYINYWMPDVPTWVSALFFLVAITLVNIVNVKSYGEFEFWFAIIKVAAIIGLIVLGVLMIFFGVGNGGDPIGLSNLWSLGGFLPNGWGGLLFSLVLVMFSYGGVELIGITAGEADNPNRSIPKAINQVMWRILIFYVGALAVIITIFPWNQVDAQGSPFVIIFSKIGIPAAAAILNAVVLTAALSAYNSGLYSNGRMLYGLAQQGNAPKLFSRVNRHGIPVAAVLTSSAITMVTVIMNFLFPGKVFLYLISIATFASIINWTMILLTQLKFRRKLGGGASGKLLFRMPLHPYSTYLCLAFLVMVVVLMGCMPDMRFSLYVAPLWILLLYVAYKVRGAR